MATPATRASGTSHTSGYWYGRAPVAATSAVGAIPAGAGVCAGAANASDGGAVAISAVGPLSDPAKSTGAENAGVYATRPPALTPAGADGSCGGGSVTTGSLDKSRYVNEADAGGEGGVARGRAENATCHVSRPSTAARAGTRASAANERDHCPTKGDRSMTSRAGPPVSVYTAGARTAQS